MKICMKLRNIMFYRFYSNEGSQPYGFFLSESFTISEHLLLFSAELEFALNLE